MLGGGKIELVVRVWRVEDDEGRRESGSGDGN